MIKCVYKYLEAILIHSNRRDCVILPYIRECSLQFA